MLGYDADPSQARLVVNEAEAKQVRQIFRIYLQHGALIPALAEINRRGFRMKSWTTEKGRAHIGQQFDRPALVLLLTNVLYVGEVKHKGKVYPGEQPAIVDRKTWAKVNDLLGSRSQHWPDCGGDSPIRFPVRVRPAGFQAPQSDNGARPVPLRSVRVLAPGAIATVPHHGWHAIVQR